MPSHRPQSDSHAEADHHLAGTDSDVYLCGDERMRRPDYKAKKHGRPMPVRYKRVRLVADPELALIEMSRLQREAGAL